MIKRAPDRAYVTIAAESRAKTSAEAQKLNADAMQAVLQKVKGMGLPPEAIRTSGYELHPELVRAIDGANLAKQRPALRHVLWLESVSVDGGELPAPAVAAAKTWADAGIAAEMRGYTGPAFWHTHERDRCATTVRFAGGWRASKDETALL